MKMFRNRSSEGHLNGGQSPASPSGHGVSSPVYDSQESSWIGLLSVLSRPALSFFQKYVTGQPRSPALTSETGPGEFTGGLKNYFAGEETEIFKQLDDMVPAPRLAYLQCEHDAASGLLEPSAESSLSWLTADSLRELGIQNPEEVNLNRTGHFSSVRTVLSHVVLSSSQEIKPTAGKELGTSKTRTWWGSFWGGEGSQKGLLSDFWAEEEMTGRLRPQQQVAETKGPETTDVFVLSRGMESTLGENAGSSDHKDHLINNGGLHVVQNTDGSTPDHQLSIGDPLSRLGAAAACSEVALLTPDQDNGYSSLEEEQVQMSHLYNLKASGGKTGEISDQTELGEEKGQVAEEEETEEKGACQEPQPAGAMVLSTVECQNKAIAFIMGCPCSDDDSSQSDRESSDDDDDDDDDDGFDSEGSSDLSSSSDEDDDDASDSDSEGGSEAERLWNSLCQSQDPYNPRNFTAQLHTSSTLPRTIPTSSTPPSSTQSTPNSSPQLAATASLPCTHDAWDDSTSASEVDEAEGFLLWNSFSCSSDPYSPFNFQAPLRTRGPIEAAPRVKSRVRKGTQTPPQAPHHKASSPPEYRNEEAEERLNKSLSEGSCSSSTSRRCAPTKKVRFSDDVEEFFASCGEEEEDRRGPWEELARDRCRFLRRCQEVEQSIAYCLQPQHRSLMYRRLTILYVQNT